MIRVMFVCHGNICRSPMAEYLFRDMVEKRGLGDRFFIASSATSTEEIGNGVHYGTRRILESCGINPDKKRAVQLKREDKDKYDFFIGMDDYNIMNMERILDGGNVVKLLDFTDEPRAIADPWYTGNFSDTYKDIIKGCTGFLKYLEKEGLLQ